MRDFNGSETPPSSGSQGEAEAAGRVIPVVQEDVTVSRVSEETGAKLRVRIDSREERERVPTVDIVEELSVEHVPINRFVVERAPPRQEGDVVIIPVFETVSVVETRLLLKEEVRIVRHRREVRQEQEMVLHKEIPIVERQTSDQEPWRQEAVPETREPDGQNAVQAPGEGSKSA